MKQNKLISENVEKIDYIPGGKYLIVPTQTYTDKNGNECETEFVILYDEYQHPAIDVSYSGVRQCYSDNIPVGIALTSLTSAYKEDDCITFVKRKDLLRRTGCNNNAELKKMFGDKALLLDSSSSHFVITTPLWNYSEKYLLIDVKPMKSGTLRLEVEDGGAAPIRRGAEATVYGNVDTTMVESFDSDEEREFLFKTIHKTIKQRDEYSDFNFKTYNKEIEYTKSNDEQGRDL